MSSNATLTCGTCGHTNIFPSMQMAIMQGDVIMAFCNTCASITQQRVTVLHQVSPKRSPSPHHPSPARGSFQALAGVTNSVQSPNDTRLPDQQFWELLENRLRTNGLSPQDLAYSDDNMRRRLLTTFGYDESAQQRVLQMLNARYRTAAPLAPMNQSNVPVTGSSNFMQVPPTFGGTSRSGSATPIATPSNLAPQPTSGRGPSTASNMLSAGNLGASRSAAATPIPQGMAAGPNPYSNSPRSQSPSTAMAAGGIRTSAVGSKAASITEFPLQGNPQNSTPPAITPMVRQSPITAAGNISTNEAAAANPNDNSRFSAFGSTPAAHPQQPAFSNTNVFAAAPAPAQPYQVQKPQPFGGFTPPSAVAHPGAANNSLLPAVDPRRASTIQGLEFIDNQVIARCSVYPDLPAEFWCAACNVLVSSRCHVQGAHKDHPFIPIRLAAEQHVGELSSWAERARVQLNSTESVLNNLRHAEQQVTQTIHQQYDVLEQNVNQIVEDLMRWKEQLKMDMQQQATAQISSIQTAAHRTEELHQLYSGQMLMCEPLLSNVPPVDQNDKISDEWALRLLDFVSKLKNVTAEPIPMPKLSLPEVSCSATPATHMELLKAIPRSLPVRLPDLVDPGYFNFPHPSASARVPFTLTEPAEAKQNGVLVHTGKTLTRAENAPPLHTVVTGSQVFYTGTMSWEVHVDRLGQGPGRLLAGIVVHGSDGEGVVWDGHRIVGPNEGESRTIDEKYVVRSGTILRFVLELEGQQRFLNCFFDRDGVARVPLPMSGNGWVPAFSVFGPQDQITVIPSNALLPEGSTIGVSSTIPGALPGRVGEAGAAENANDAGSPKTTKKIREQEVMISSLQQQLNAVKQRMDAEQYTNALVEAQQRNLGTGAGSPVGGRQQAPGGMPPVPGTPRGAEPRAPLPRPATSASPVAIRPGAPPSAATVALAAAAFDESAPPVVEGTGRLTLADPPTGAVGPPSSASSTSGAARSTNEAYSNELQQLMRQVNNLRQQ